MKPSIKASVRSKIAKIVAGSYSSDDLKLLYVDVRDYTATGSITREIGDYIAHPKAKDRGISHVRTTEQLAAFKRLGDLMSGRLPGENGRIVVKPAFTGPDIVEDLIAQLDQMLGISGDIKRAILIQVSGLSACAITILQDAIIKVGTERLVAHAGCSEGKLNLFVTYPVDFRGRVVPTIAALVEGPADPSFSSQIQLFDEKPFWVEVTSGAIAFKRDAS